MATTASTVSCRTGMATDLSTRRMVPSHPGGTTEVTAGAGFRAIRPRLQ
jgi:hypothetical protein